MLPQQQRCRNVLAALGQHERRLTVPVLKRGVGLGVEQRLHDHGEASDSSGHQGGDVVGDLQVDARAALQQHPHHRLLPSRGGRHQQRRVVDLCAACVHLAALVQPRIHGLRIAVCGRVKRGRPQRRLFGRRLFLRRILLRLLLPYCSCSVRCQSGRPGLRLSRLPLWACCRSSCAVAVCL